MTTPTTEAGRALRCGHETITVSSADVAGLPNAWACHRCRTRFYPASATVLVASGAAIIVACGKCASTLLVTESLVHHDDGSHTYSPPQEAEARNAVLDEVAAKVKGLDAPGGQWSERGFEKARAAILAVIASLRNRSGGGHSAGAGHYTTRKPSRNRSET